MFRMPAYDPVAIAVIKGQPPVLTSPNLISTLPQRVACARLSRPYLPGPTFPQRSPPSLLTTAACGGLRSAPDCRTRRALLHLSYSCACRLDRREGDIGRPIHPRSVNAASSTDLFAILAKNGLDRGGERFKGQANSSTKPISFDFHGIMHRATSHSGNNRDSYSPLCLRRDRAGIDLCVRN